MSTLLLTCVTGDQLPRRSQRTACSTLTWNKQHVIRRFQHNPQKSVYKARRFEAQKINK
jgi:hypothetical protein